MTAVLYAKHHKYSSTARESVDRRDFTRFQVEMDFRRILYIVTGSGSCCSDCSCVNRSLVGWAKMKTFFDDGIFVVIPSKTLHAGLRLET